MPDNRPQRCKHTGTGPPKRPNNAEKHGMDACVTPRSIAYIAVLVRGFLYVLAQLTCPLPASLFSYGRNLLDE